MAKGGSSAFTISMSSSPAECTSETAFVKQVIECSSNMVKFSWLLLLKVRFPIPSCSVCESTEKKHEEALREPAIICVHW